MDERLRERVELCQDNVLQNPYSHPVAAGWYAQDVPALLAVEQAARRLKEAERIDAKHGFHLPGDSALAVYLNTLDEALARVREETDVGGDDAPGVDARNDENPAPNTRSEGEGVSFQPPQPEQPDDSRAGSPFDRRTYGDYDRAGERRYRSRPARAAWRTRPLLMRGCPSNGENGARMRAMSNDERNLTSAWVRANIRWIRLHHPNPLVRWWWRLSYWTRRQWWRRHQAYLLVAFLLFLLIVSIVAETVAPGQGVFGP